MVMGDRDAIGTVTKATGPTMITSRDQTVTDFEDKISQACHSYSLASGPSASAMALRALAEGAPRCRAYETVNLSCRPTRPARAGQAARTWTAWCPIVLTETGIRLSSSTSCDHSLRFRGLRHAGRDLCLGPWFYRRRPLACHPRSREPGAWRGFPASERTLEIGGNSGRIGRCWLPLRSERSAFIASRPQRSPETGDKQIFSTFRQGGAICSHFTRQN